MKKEKNKIPFIGIVITLTVLGIVALVAGSFTNRPYEVSSLEKNCYTFEITLPPGTKCRVQNFRDYEDMVRQDLLYDARVMSATSKEAYLAVVQMGFSGNQIIRQGWYPKKVNQTIRGSGIPRPEVDFLELWNEGTEGTIVLSVILRGRDRGIHDPKTKATTWIRMVNEPRQPEVITLEKVW